VPWGAADAYHMWSPGDPVVLTTDGHRHLAYVRLVDSCLGRRWLKPGPGWRIHPVELTLRNPRELWADCWELQLAIAMLSGAAGDTRCAWMADPDQALEPDLYALLQLAQEELVVARPLPATPTGPVPAAAPAIYARTRSQLEALRLPADAVEPVNLAPGR
jgi:hypothetical protein